MIAYLLKSATCLGLLLAFYHLVLEREKMHNFNRFYLLGSVLFSFLAPLYVIYIHTDPVVIQNILTPTTNFTTENIPSETLIETPIDYASIFTIIYFIISSVLLIRFGRNLFNIIIKTKKHININYKNAVLVLVEDKILPHTFWNFIFINKQDYLNKKIEQELFTHELTHVCQKHTLDVLVLELVQSIFWINPFLILLKKRMQLNHEFLADEKVIREHKNTFQYQHLLLNKAAWKNEYYLASNLNYSLTKKRLKMMTTQSSPTKILLKKLAVIPLLTGFLFLFAERVEAQRVTEVKEEPIETIVEEISSKKQDLSKSEIYKEYYFKKGRFTFKDKNGNKISKKYSELTDKEKKRLVPPPSLKLKKKTPTKKQFEALKDNSKYAVWIDGKVIKNQTLNNYKYSDFVRYSNSYVYKNARSKRFPQENQAHLETKKYFNYQNQSRVNKFLKYLEEKNNIEVVNEKKSKAIEIKEQSKKYNEPSSNGSKQSFLKTPELKSYSNKTTTGFKNIKGVTLYYVSENGNTKYYNKEGKLFNKNGEQLSNLKSKASEIIPEMYVRNVYYKGKIFCEFIDDKPNLHQQEKKSTLNQFKEIFKSLKEKDNPLNKYKSTYKIYEALRDRKPHYIKSNDKRKDMLEKIFSELGSMYFKLTKENKQKVKRPIHPHAPYIRLMKNNKVFYKLRNELTKEDELLIPPPPPVPNATKEQILKAEKAYKNWKKRTGNSFKSIPPPPPPRHHLDQVIEMAKKGAKFYYEGESIDSDKAIKLLKNNKKLSIHSESTNNSNYKVWISKSPIE